MFCVVFAVRIVLEKLIQKNYQFIRDWEKLSVEETKVFLFCFFFSFSFCLTKVFECSRRI